MPAAPGTRSRVRTGVSISIGIGPAAAEPGGPMPSCEGEDRDPQSANERVEETWRMFDPRAAAEAAQREQADANAAAAASERLAATQWPYPAGAQHPRVDRARAEKSNHRLMVAGVTVTLAGTATFVALCSDEYGWLCPLGGLPGGLTAVFAGVPMITTAALPRRALRLAPEVDGRADLATVRDPTTTPGRRYTEYLTRAGAWSTGIGGVVLIGGIVALKLYPGLPDSGGSDPFAPDANDAGPRARGVTPRTWDTR